MNTTRESVCVCVWGGGRSDASAWYLSSSFLFFVVATKMRASISEFFFPEREGLRRQIQRDKLRGSRLRSELSVNRIYSGSTCASC